MQTNANKEEKNIVERWDWKDYMYDYNPWGKKHNRKLRRKRIKTKFKRDLKEYIK